MNSNQDTNQFGQGSKIDKKENEDSKRNPKENDDDFLSGDNQIKYHPNMDKFEVSPEEEDRYNNGSSEHDDLIENPNQKFSSCRRNGSHRNH